MKNFKNSIENEKSTLPIPAITTLDYLPQKTNSVKSAYDMMFFSSQKYSSRVWDAVKADILNQQEQS